MKKYDHNYSISPPHHLQHYPANRTYVHLSMKIITIQKSKGEGGYCANVHGHQNNQQFGKNEIDALSHLLAKLKENDPEFIEHPK